MSKYRTTKDLEPILRAQHLTTRAPMLQKAMFSCFTKLSLVEKHVAYGALGFNWRLTHDCKFGFWFALQGNRTK
jgi:hypothetical protein